MNSTLLKPNAKLQYSIRISHGTYWDEFDQQSNISWFRDHLIYSRDLNVWLKGNVLMSYYMFVNQFLQSLVQFPIGLSFPFLSIPTHFRSLSHKPKSWFDWFKTHSLSNLVLLYSTTWLPVFLQDWWWKPSHYLYDLLVSWLLNMFEDPILSKSNHKQDMLSLPTNIAWKKDPFKVFSTSTEWRNNGKNIYEFVSLST